MATRVHRFLFTPQCSLVLVSERYLCCFSCPTLAQLYLHFLGGEAKRVFDSVNCSDAGMTIMALVILVSVRYRTHELTV